MRRKHLLSSLSRRRKGNRQILVIPEWPGQAVARELAEHVALRLGLLAQAMHGCGCGSAAQSHMRNRLAEACQHLHLDQSGKMRESQRLDTRKLAATASLSLRI